MGHGRSITASMMAMPQSETPRPKFKIHEPPRERQGIKEHNSHKAGDFNAFFDHPLNCERTGDD